MDPSASILNPMGPRPRVLPAEFPHRNPRYPPSPSSNGQPRPPPIIPRRTQRHSIESAEHPGRTTDVNSRNHTQAAPPTPHRTPIYSGTSCKTQRVSELSFEQLQEEVHLLRIRVEDQGVELNKKERDLQYCHEQLKQLTTMLTEKKEELLKSEDRVVSLQADLSEARENLLDMHRNEHTSQSIRHSVSESELALEREVDHLHGLLEEERKQNNYHTMQLQKERGQWKHKVVEHEEEVRKYQEQEKNLMTRIHQPQQHQQQQRHPQQYHPQQHHPQQQPLRVDGDIKGRMEMLEAQVMIYKEDFETERADRTRAQASIITLKEEVASLQQTNELLVDERGLQQPHPHQR